MGGASYIFTVENDAFLIHNSALCNLHVLEAARLQGVQKIFTPPLQLTYIQRVIVAVSFVFTTSARSVCHIIAQETCIATEEDVALIVIVSISLCSEVSVLTVVLYTGSASAVDALSQGLTLSSRQLKAFR